MGLSTTAAHALWAVAVLVGGGALATTLLAEVDETRAADADAATRQADRLATRFEVVDVVVQYGDGTVRVELLNTGDRAVDLRDVTVLFDGVFVDVAAYSSDHGTGRSVFAPGTRANLTVDAPWEPRRMVVAGDSASPLAWENTQSSYFVALVVSPDPASVEFLATQQFTASGTDQYGEPYSTQGAVTWSTTVTGSSIDANGLFTAGTTVASGFVTATQGAVSGSADVDVYRNPPVVTAISVTPDPSSVEFLATQQFTAVCTDQYALVMTCPALAWSTTVAGSSVDANGLFTAGTTAGSGTVTAAYGAVSDAASVTVYRNAAVLTAIALAPPSASVEFLATQQFTATCTDQYALAMTCPALTWSTTASGSSVSSSGLFTAGTTATSGVVQAQSGAVTDTSDVTVYRNAAVLTSIAVAPDPSSVEFLATQQFTATCTDQYGLPMACGGGITWSTTVGGSSVDASGLFTAGTTATSGLVEATDGVVSGAADVTVYRNAAVLTVIDVTPSSATVQATKTQQFTAACTDQYALAMTCPTLTWSTNIGAATVSTGGLFTAGTTLASGTVTAQNGAVSDTAATTVSALVVKIDWVRMYNGAVEDYSWRDTETATKRARIVAVSDGLAVQGVSVTLVTKDPSLATVDTDVATSDAAGEASGSYRPGQGAPLGTYTTEVTSVSASWISWTSGVPPNDEQSVTYTVVD